MYNQMTKDAQHFQNVQENHLNDDESLHEKMEKLEIVDESLHEQIEKWKREQFEMVQQLIFLDTLEWQRRLCVGAASDNRLQFVAGVDISFSTIDSNFAVAGVVVVEVPTCKVVYKEVRPMPVEVPYVPTFLAFREVPVLATMLKPLLEEKRHAHYRPQVIMVDGNGRIHPRQCGSACQLGLALQWPCFGVAKNLLFEGMNQDRNVVKQNVIDGKLKSQWDHDDLVLVDSNQVVGLIVKSSKESKKPVYLSAGHLISLETSLWVMQQCTKYRVPEPIRQADQITREELRKLKK